MGPLRTCGALKADFVVGRGQTPESARSLPIGLWGALSHLFFTYSLISRRFLRRGGALGGAAVESVSAWSWGAPATMIASSSEMGQWQVGTGLRAGASGLGGEGPAKGGGLAIRPPPPADRVRTLAPVSLL